jgi:hypothetical protein
MNGLLLLTARVQRVGSSTDFAPQGVGVRGRETWRCNSEQATSDPDRLSGRRLLRRHEVTVRCERPDCRTVWLPVVRVASCVIEPEEACPLLDGAEHDPCSRDVTGHCCIPVRSLNGVETIEFQLAQLVDALGFTVGQGLVNDPVHRSSIGVAELVGGLLISGTGEHQRDGGFSAGCGQGGVPVPTRDPRQIVNRMPYCHIKMV